MASAEPVFNVINKSRYDGIFIPSEQRTIAWTSEKWRKDMDDFIQIKSNEIKSFQSILIKKDNRNPYANPGTKWVSLYDGLQRMSELTAIMSLLYYEDSIKYVYFDVKDVHIEWAPELKDVGSVFKYIIGGFWRPTSFIGSSPLTKDAKNTTYYENFEELKHHFDKYTDQQKEALADNLKKRLMWWVNELEEEMDIKNTFIDVNSKGTAVLTHQIVKLWYDDTPNAQSYVGFTNLQTRFKVEQDNGDEFNGSLIQAAKLFLETLPKDDPDYKEYHDNPVKNGQELDLWGRNFSKYVPLETLEKMADVWLDNITNNAMCRSLKVPSSLKNIIFRLMYSNNTDKYEVMELLYKFLTIEQYIKPVRGEKISNYEPISSNWGNTYFRDRIQSAIDIKIKDLTLDYVSDVIKEYLVALNRRFFPDGSYDWIIDRISDVSKSSPLKDKRSVAKTLLYLLDISAEPLYKNRRVFSTMDVNPDHVLSIEESKFLSEDSESYINQIGNAALLCQSANKSFGAMSPIEKAKTEDYRNSGFALTTQIQRKIESTRRWDYKSITENTELRINQIVELYKELVA